MNNDNFKLYDERLLRSKGVMDIWLIIGIVAAFFMASYYMGTSLPSWLGGGKTKTELIVENSKLISDIKAAETINGQLEQAIILQDDFKKIDEQAAIKNDQTTTQIKETTTKIKETVSDKIVTIKENPKLSETEKDDAFLEALVESMEVAHAQLASVQLSQKVQQ